MRTDTVVVIDPMWRYWIICTHTLALVFIYITDRQTTVYYLPTLWQSHALPLIAFPKSNGGDNRGRLLVARLAIQTGPRSTPPANTRLTEDR